MSTTKATVVPTGPGGVALPAPAPIAAELTKIRLVDLFPAFLKKKPTDLQPSIYAVRCPELEADVAKAIYQAYAQTKRRAERLPIETAEFAQVEKSRKAEHARRTYRTGTRFNQPTPTRKRPLSTLLAPPMTADINLLRPIVWSIKTDGSPPPDPPARNSVGFPFPGSIPCSLMRADIMNHLYDPATFWSYAPKTNGLRFLMAAVTLHGQRLLLLTNRAQQLYIIRMTAPEAIFDGTILDCELVPLHNGSYCLLAFDAVMVCGVPCGEHNYLVRLQHASDAVEAWSVALMPPMTTETIDDKPPSRPAIRQAWHAGAPFSVRVKSVYAGSQMPDVLESTIPALDHDTDGLIATHVEPGVQIGQTRSIFKIKRGTDNTIECAFAPTGNADTNGTGAADLLVLESDHRWRVWSKMQLFSDDSAADVSKRLGIPIPTDTIKTESAARSFLLVALTGRIVECRFVIIPSSSVRLDGRWTIDAVRDDKLAPNRLSTAEFTFQNIEENLTMLDVFPDGSIPAAARERLKLYEAAMSSGTRSSAVNSVVVPPLAPVSVAYLSRF